MATVAEDLNFFAAEAARRSPDQVKVSLLPVMIVMYATLLPREITFSLGGLMFYADRIALMVAMPWVIYKLTQGAIRFVLPDFLVVISSIWTIIAMYNVYDFPTALTSGGSVAFDSTVGYYLARISFRSLREVRLALIALSPVLAVIGFILVLESLTHSYIIQTASESIFGRLPKFFQQERASRLEATDLGNYRYGLLRAKGPFSHPIHAGIYMGSLAALYGMSGLRGWPGWLGRFAALTAVFTLSSAAFGSLAVNYIGMTFEWLTYKIREVTWNVWFILIGIALFLAQTTTNIGAVGFVIRYLTFNSATAFFRQLIWQYGSQSALAHPWFGIGYEPYERPAWMVTASIDAHWLAIAVRSGLITSITLFVATVTAIIALARASNHVNKVDKRFYHGIAISLFGFGLMMFTVTLWGNVQSWFNLLLGMCVACAQRGYTVGYQPTVRPDVAHKRVRP